MSQDRPADTGRPRLRRAGRLVRRRFGLVAVVVALALAVSSWELSGRGMPGLSAGIARRADPPPSLAAGDDTTERALDVARDGLRFAVDDPDMAAAARRAGKPVVADPDATLVAAKATVDASDIPPVALRAYMRAERVLDMSDPECGLQWWLLAAIGRVESNHGRYGGVVLDESGFGDRPIRGVPLDGAGDVGRVDDTDGGAVDGDPRVDRAVGPMQFIPATWERVGVDADGDGERNPDNIFDAATGAAVYLCSGETDLADTEQMEAALKRYNPSDAYVAVVSRVARAYQRGEGLDSLSLDYGVPGRDGGFTGPYGGRPGLGFDSELDLPDTGMTPLPPANPADPPAAAGSGRAPSTAADRPAPPGSSQPPGSSPPGSSPPGSPTPDPGSPTPDPGSPAPDPGSPAPDPGSPPRPPAAGPGTTTPPSGPSRPTEPTTPTRPTEPGTPTPPSRPPSTVGPTTTTTTPPAECPPGTRPVSRTSATTTPGTTTGPTTTTTTTSTTTTTAPPSSTTTTTAPDPPIPPGCERVPPDDGAETAPAEAGGADDGDGAAPARAAAIPLLAVLVAAPTLRRRDLLGRAPRR